MNGPIKRKQQKSVAQSCEKKRYILERECWTLMLETWMLIIYCIHSFPTIIYKGNSAGRDENSLGKQKSL